MAEYIYEHIGVRYSPEEIGCKGCLDEEEPADPNCPVRPCVKGKNLENCGYCENFPCDKLKTRMNFFEDRIGDLTKVPEEDYHTFIEPYMSKKRLERTHASIDKE